jgi:hypothetical protein
VIVQLYSNVKFCYILACTTLNETEQRNEDFQTKSLLFKKKHTIILLPMNQINHSKKKEVRKNIFKYNNNSNIKQEVDKE